MDRIESPSSNHKSVVFLAVFAVAASVIGWLFLTHLRPVVIEVGCSEIAEKTTGLAGQGRYNMDFEYSFYNEKQKCINSSIGTAQ